HEPDLRGFEWRYWDRQLNAARRSERLPDVKGPVGTWAVSRDGSRVARLSVPSTSAFGRRSPGQEGDGPVLHVWDVASGKLLLSHRVKPKGSIPGTIDRSFTSISPVLSDDGRRVAVLLNLWADKAGRNIGTGTHFQVLDVATEKVLFQDDQAGVTFGF